MMHVNILPPTNGAPAGKLAEAELCFADGLLSGLKLDGFSIWEGRDGRGRNVSFPARQYAVHGERRSYALLRGIERSTTGEPLRERILKAYAEREDETLPANAS